MVKELTIMQTLIPFLSRPKEALHLAFLSKEIHEPHPTVRLWLQVLEEEGILKKSFKGRLTLFSLNYDHPLLLEYLVVAEKWKIIKKAKEELLFKELLSFLDTSLTENNNALLFGSAVLSFKTASDIDILITGSIDQKKVEMFSKKVNKQIHLIVVKSLSHVSAALKVEIIKKHLIIKGSEDIARWLLW